MSDPQFVSYECTPQGFQAVSSYPVRWLEWEEDYSLVARFWPEQTPNGWYAARQEGFQYCAVIEQNQIRALAAVWRYSEVAWEVASVYTHPEVRRRGYAKAVVSFVTAYILGAGKLATCSTGRDNRGMQRVAESVGFRKVTF
ncbi:MAG TPA: GNAT family N-acetyltransferase [Anaerolineales bacterium]|nr:GNAT family N-acetyltransferase [Anaerolineales bacterium]